MLRNGKEPQRAGPMGVLQYIRVSSDRQASKEDGRHFLVLTSRVAVHNHAICGRSQKLDA